AAGLLFFRRELAPGGNVLLALSALAAALGQRLELGNDLALARLVVDVIVVILVRILSGATRTTAGRLRSARLRCRGCAVRCRGGGLACRLLRSGLLGGRGLRRRLSGCLFGSRLLGSGRLLSGSLGSGFTGGGLGRRLALSGFPSLHCKRVDIAGRRHSLGFLHGLGRFGGNTGNFGHSRFP